jgi:hypothetical protein
MEFDFLSVLDYMAAFVVILCIASKFKARWIWLPYAGACVAYTVINIYYGIYGAAGLNAIVGLVALFNFFTDKKGEDESKRSKEA